MKNIKKKKTKVKKDKLTFPTTLGRDEMFKCLFIENKSISTFFIFLVSYLTRVGGNVDYDLEVFFEATEDWNSAMTLSNSMAFISQFGEVCLSSENVMKYYN